MVPGFVKGETVLDNSSVVAVLITTNDFIGHCNAPLNLFAVVICHSLGDGQPGMANINAQKLDVASGITIEGNIESHAAE